MRAEVLPAAPPPSAADEANHRIANSLQLLAALIGSDARGIEDARARAALEKAQGMVQAIAAIHRHLHVATDPAATGIDLGGYLVDLTHRLADTCPPHRPILVAVDPVRVDADTASSIGILVTELVINACKHAYPPDRPGAILVSLSSAVDGGFRLIVADDGVGIAANCRREGLGERVIGSIVARLGATVTREDAGPGLRFRVDVPASCR